MCNFLKKMAVKWTECQTGRLTKYRGTRYPPGFSTRNRSTVTELSTILIWAKTSAFQVWFILEVFNMASDLTSQVLEILSRSNESIVSADAFPSTPAVAVKAALDRLRSREMVIYKTIDREEAILTPEAKGIAAEGSHEAKVFEAVRKLIDGLKIAELPVRWLNCMPARLDDGFCQDTDRRCRVLWVKRAQRLARVKLSKKGGSEKIKIF